MLWNRVTYSICSGIKKFKTPMNFFKICAGKWKMFTLFEPKDGVQTFINPKFAEKDYEFIGDILRRQWPQKEIVQVVKQV